MWIFYLELFKSLPIIMKSLQFLSEGFSMSLTHYFKSVFFFLFFESFYLNSKVERNIYLFTRISCNFSVEHSACQKSCWVNWIVCWESTCQQTNKNRRPTDRPLIMRNHQLTPAQFFSICLLIRKTNIREDATGQKKHWSLIMEGHLLDYN